jgi:hypothetical protein
MIKKYSKSAKKMVFTNILGKFVVENVLLVRLKIKELWQTGIY